VRRKKTAAESPRRPLWVCVERSGGERSVESREQRFADNDLFADRGHRGSAACGSSASSLAFSASIVAFSFLGLCTQVGIRRRRSRCESSDAPASRAAAPFSHRAPLRQYRRRCGAGLLRRGFHRELDHGPLAHFRGLRHRPQDCLRLQGQGRRREGDWPRAQRALHARRRLASKRTGRRDDPTAGLRYGGSVRRRADFQPTTCRSVDPRRRHKRPSVPR
jgi:hypothetical protein